MIISKIVLESDDLDEIFRIRYKIFVEREKEAPANLYPSGILKDNIDNSAIHIACYQSDNHNLLGFLTVVVKDRNTVLPIENQHNLRVEPNSAEIMKIFEESGCKIEIKVNSQVPSKLFDSFLKLYQDTESNNLDTINYLHYKNFNDFIRLDEKYNWIIVKQNDKVIGFALLVIEGDTLTLKHVGLDYAVNRETYTYFNLFYRAFQFAIENKLKNVVCGSTAYEVKLSLGCQLVPRTASILFNEKADEIPTVLLNKMNLGGSDE
ncbi:TPA: peptidogalycan biosysnthesis protein [Streptococcus agalactiae]